MAGDDVLAGGRGLRLRVVAALAGAALVAGYLFWRWWAGQIGALPAPSLPAAILLLVLGAAEFAAARRIRRGVSGASRDPLDPLWSYRMLLIGQAAALTGTLAAGWSVAFIAAAWPDTDAASVRSDALAAAALALAAGVLAAGGLGIQRACRIGPPGQQAEPRE